MSENDSQEGQAPKCGAKSRSGEPCKRPAGAGTDHVGIGYCKNHGGSTPTHVKAARMEQARRAAEEFGLPIETDPHEALLEELHRTAGIIAWYSQQISGISSGQMSQPFGGGGGGIPQEEMHVYVRALHDERKHFTAVAKTCIQVGIEERRVKIAEAQGQLMAQIVDGILAALGIDKTPEVREVVRQQFTLIQGGLAA